MLLQETVDPIMMPDSVPVLSYFAGIITLAAIFVFYRKYRAQIELERQPLVVLFDLTTLRLFPGGWYVDIKPIMIPVENGSVRQLWGIETSHYKIVPTYGSKESIVIQSNEMPNIILVLCKIIGFSSYGEEVHKEWARETFPDPVYSVPEKLSELPDDYLFIKPIAERDQMRSMFKMKVNGLMSISAQFNKVIGQYEQHFQEVYTHFGNMVLQKIKTTTETIMSSLQYAIDAFDVVSKERVLPMASMSRLMGIAQNKLAYSTLGTVMNHGGITDATRFIGNLASTTRSLVDSLGMVAVNKGLHQAMMGKVNQMQDDFGAVVNDNNRTKGLLHSLSQQLESTEAEKQRALAASNSGNANAPIKV
jgi:hypothetical protein